MITTIILIALIIVVGAIVLRNRTTKNPVKGGGDNIPTPTDQIN